MTDLIINRVEHEGYTEILLSPDEKQRWNAHQIMCFDFDIDPKTSQRIPPSAKINPLVLSHGGGTERFAELIKQYEIVLIEAERLQQEKRGNYELKYGGKD